MIKLSLLKAFDKLVGVYLNLTHPTIKPKGIFPAKLDQVAIIKLSAMGDVLCLMPAIRQFKQWHPQAKITFITTHRSNPQLLFNLPFLDDIQVMPMKPLAIRRFIRKHCRQHYDLCIDADQYYHISTWLAIQADFSVGFETPTKSTRLNHSLPYDLFENEKKQFFDLIATASQKILPEQLDVTLPEILSGQDQALAQEKIRSILPHKNSKSIVIYVGSGMNADFRRWPVNHYKKLIEMLCELDYEVSIAGGPDELAIKNCFVELSSKYPNCFNLIGELTLKEWLYLMQTRVDLFVGNDAGLLHIAEAAGVLIIGIFGPNIYSKWGSLNPHSTGIEIPLEDLNCRPCIVTAKGQIPNQCHRGDLACLTRIKPNDVLRKIQAYCLQ